MFEAFQRKFPLDYGRASEGEGAAVESDVSGLPELIGRFGGVSFRRGLHRVIRATDLDQWKARVSLGFPEFS